MTWFKDFHSRIKNTIGAIEADKGHYARAFKHYDAAIRLNPINPEALYNRGVAFGQAGQFDRAIADLNKAIRLKPNDPDYFTNRGTAHYLRGEHNKAIADYDEALRLNPKHATAITLRARTMARENNESAQAPNTSSQAQATSVSHTTQAAREPNRECSPVYEFEEVTPRRAKEFEQEKLSRKLGPAGDDVTVRDAYLNLTREDQSLGDEFIRIIAAIGKPKDLDRIITLVRVSNKKSND